MVESSLDILAGIRYSNREGGRVEATTSPKLFSKKVE
jgi:hypothetical protein